MPSPPGLRDSHFSGAAPSNVHDQDQRHKGAENNPLFLSSGSWLSSAFGTFELSQLAFSIRSSLK